MRLRTKNNFVVYLTPQVKDKIYKVVAANNKKFVSPSDLINKAVKEYYDNFLSFNEKFKEQQAGIKKVTLHMFLNNELKDRLKQEAKGYCKISTLIEYAVVMYLEKGELL
jgi:Arc/MetJ-type ribon-helix-helix transcriptional regulator